MITYGRRVLLLALAVGTPGTVASLLLIWTVTDFQPAITWQLTALIVGLWLLVAFAVRRRIVFPLQTISNLVAALREGDFSVRGRASYPAKPNDTLEELTREVNELAHTVHEQRLGALEATAFLRKVMEEIDVAVFSFDAERRLKFLNRAAERLIHTPTERALEASAERLGLAQYLEQSAPRLVDAAFPGATGRWEIRKSTFRQGGRPHQLLVLSDLTRTLREEELQAWQRIVRVIGHELNNSLTPIKSIAGTLQTQLDRRHRSADWEEDFARGLSVIGSRSESLSRFVSAYSQLARLPRPKQQQIDVTAVIHRVAGLETRGVVEVLDGPPVRIDADVDQIEQLLINLVRNAVDASLESGAKVVVTWHRLPGHLEVRIEDSGPGISNPANLFVPFFTTKSGGSGIGLFLSRQIAENHGGALFLENKGIGSGCVAILRLPIAAEQPTLAVSL